MTISAAFTINSVANPARHTTTYGATVNLAVSTPSGIDGFTWEIVSSSKSGTTLPTITTAGTPLGATASFAMPADPGDGLGRAFLVKFTATAQYETAITYGVVGALNDAGELPVCAGEELARDATYGWTDEFNKALNAPYTATSVADNGATGDGSTDDTTAIQDTIDAVGAAGGGVVLLPPGTYLVSAELTMTLDDVIVECVPGASISFTDLNGKLFNVTGDRCGFLNLTASVSGTAVSGNYAAYFNGASDAFLIGGATTDFYTSWYCTGTNSRFLAQRHRAQDSVGDSASLSGSGTDILIKDCVFDGSGAVSLFMSPDAASTGRIDGCTFSNSTGDGIRHSTCTGFQAVGCTFDTITDDGIQSGSGSIDVLGCKFLSITSNELEGTGFGVVAGNKGGGTQNAEVATISTGAFTLAQTGSAIEVHPESGTADDLDTISGGWRGLSVTLFPDSGDDITVKHGTGNIQLDGGADFVMTNSDDRLTLEYDGTNWVETSRSVGCDFVNDIAGTTHTFTLEDCNRPGGVASTGSSATEFTIDQVSGTAYPVNTVIPVAQIGTGALTIGATSTATLNGSSGTAVITLTGQRSSVFLWHRSSDTWVAVGDYS